MDVASVRNLGKELDVLDRLGGRHREPRPRDEQGAPQVGHGVNEVEQVLGLTSVASIDMEPDVVLAMNQGIPLVIGANRSQAARSIWTIAERIGLEGHGPNSKSVWRRRPR